MPPSWLQKFSNDHLPVSSRLSGLPDFGQLDWSMGLNASELGGGSAAAGQSFVEGLLSTSNIALHGEVSALAVEPVLGYLAVGTTTGGVHLFGKEAVQVDWNLRPANKVSNLLFKSGSPLLIVIDVKDNISIFDLSRNDPQIRAKVHASPHPFLPTATTTTGAGPSGPIHPDQPMRIAAHTARNGVLCAEVSALHNHLFIGLRDGTIDTYDLERLSPSAYRVPNLWWEEEEILRKSGVPDAPSRRHVPLIIDIKTHPTDINQLLLAYEGGVVLLDVTKRTIIRSFQLRHLPGAPGACVGDPNLIWTERAAPATCIAWRPDGLVFACGHEDGCVSFWSIDDEEKPITVRTLERRDVDKPTSFTEDMANGLAQTREPIFKLAWSGFPAQSWLSMAQQARSARTDNASSPTLGGAAQAASPQSATKDEQPATGTILTVLGGATELHPPGLVCFHFPPFSWPYASYWNTKTPETSAKVRQALYASLLETKGSRYATTSPVEDFILLPRDSPYYGLAYDPTAVITMLGADPRLPPLPPPAAARGLKAFAFPPPSAAGDVRHQEASAEGQTLIQSSFAQQKLNLPLALSTAGGGAILGAKLVDITPSVYRNLTASTDAVKNEEHARRESSTAFLSPNSLSSHQSNTASANAAPSHEHNLPLHGGRATPVASGTNASTAEAMTILARAQRWRLLITWHHDGTVRFHDASPQLLLLGQDQAPMLNPQDGKEAFTPGFLQKGFPSPLPHLTIDVRKLINHTSMNGHPLFERLKANASRLRIVDVQFAADAQEVAIVLRSGQVFHYKFGFAHYSQTDEVVEAVAEEVEQDEEAAAHLAHMHRRSSSVNAGPSDRMMLSDLDRSMAGAIHDLNIDANMQGNGSAPPPRPRRDPKRLSLARGAVDPAISHDRRPSNAPSMDAAHSFVPPANPPSHEAFGRMSDMNMPVEEITLVGHLAIWRTDGFKPNIIVDLNRGEASATSVSDVGFMAVACGPALALIDLRGPRIIVREGFGGGGDFVRTKESLSREERKIAEEESKSAVQHLSISICRTLATPALSPTLVVVRESGYTTLWTLTKEYGSDAWTCQRTHGQQLDELQCSPGGGDGGKGGVQILDMAGNISYAIPAELQRSLREHARGDEGVSRFNDAAASDMNLMLCFGRQSITLRAGICGPKIAKADVSGSDAIRAASVIDRRGEKVCLVVTLKSLFIFALPSLQLITRVQRHNRAHEERLTIARATVSLDGSGDFVEVANSLDVCMWTVFAALPRPGLPSLMLYTPPSMPIAPNMLGSMASSVANWIGGKSTALTQGAQLDELLAAGQQANKNKRASMPKLPEQKYVQEKNDERERKALVQEEMQRRTADEAAYGGSAARLQQSRAAAAGRLGQGGGGVDAAGQQVNAAQGTAAWTFDLAKQRGEMVNSLEQGLSNLERGASNWMKSAREEMIKQAAKDKLSKYF